MNFRIEPSIKTEVSPDLQTVISLELPADSVLPPDNKNVDKCERTLFITGKHREFLATNDPRHPGSVPLICFQGVYLYKAGFAIGTRIKVSVKYGRIVITPDAYQPYIPEEQAEQLRIWTKNHPDG